MKSGPFRVWIECLFLLALFFCLVVACRRAKVQKPLERSDRSVPVVEPISSPQVAQKNGRTPKGIFFLLERAAVTTDSGVIGFAPGTRVRLLEEKGETVRVSDGATSFDVPTSNLTDDVYAGMLASRQDAKSQQALADYMQRQNEVYRAAREADKKWMDEQDRRVAARRQAAAETLARRANPLDRGSYNKTYSYPYSYPYQYWYHHHYPAYVDRFGQGYWIDSAGQMHYVP